MNKEYMKSQWEIQKRQNREFLFALRNKRKIGKFYEHFTDKLDDILKYLKDDFNVKTLTVKNKNLKREIMKIDDAIDDYKIDFKEKINLKLFPIRPLLYGLRIIHWYYPQYLEILKLKCKLNKYKNIDFKEEEKIIKDADNYAKYF